eukprot:523600-Hanusia_phi.AAC.2
MVKSRARKKTSCRTCRHSGFFASRARANATKNLNKGRGLGRGGGRERDEGRKTKSEEGGREGREKSI